MSNLHQLSLDDSTLDSVLINCVRVFARRGRELRSLAESQPQTNALQHSREEPGEGEAPIEEITFRGKFGNLVGIEGEVLPTREEQA